LPVGVNVGVDFGGPGTQATTRRPILYGLGELVATAERTQQQRNADEAQTFNKNASTERVIGVEIFKVGGSKCFHDFYPDCDCG
jgi:hypothetical protein